ncbi:MAG: HAMP domain-containing sensor histidine kinase [Elusimicrobiota bacterium]
MKVISLRSGRLFAAVVVACAALAVIFIFRSRYDAQEQMTIAMEYDAAILGKLPALLSGVRRSDALTDLYLVTGNDTWRSKRAQASKGLISSLAGIAELAYDEKDAALVRDLNNEIGDFIEMQEALILKKRRGNLSPKEARQAVAMQRHAEGILESMAALKDANLSGLRERRKVWQKENRQILLLTVLTALFSLGATAFAYLRFVEGPVMELDGRMRQWEFGDTPEDVEPAAPLEITSLFRSFNRLTQRLGREFARERASAEQKSKLVSIVNHEFNNALAVIQTGVTFLQMKELDISPEERNKFLTMIKANAQTLSTQVLTLLELGRLESGKLAVKIERVDIVKIAQQVVEQQIILAGKKKQTFALEAPPSALFVDGDIRGLALVINNLVGNAIKYTPEGGDILLKVRREDSDAIVSVRDSGIGIDPEQQEKIFKSYYRTEKGKDTAMGFGVGLSVANTLLHAHDSRLNVESEAGKGSTFSFRLPCSG